MDVDVPVRSEDHALTRKLQWLALLLTPGVGAGRARKLIEHFGEIGRIFAASLTELEAFGLPAVAAQGIGLGKSLELASEEYDHAREFGASLLVPGDAEYPKRLLEIYDPPLVLYLKGNAEVLDKSGISVIGTRHPTPYGISMAERLACDLAAHGLIIFSGMARGIDTAAHRGALNAHGQTVAIWGTGIDEVYPKENRKIADQILETGGAIITEFPLGTFPAPQNFPVRNRIISGISLGTLVIEAAEYSGTRVTARCALEQGREVFAVPGNVTNKNSWGPNTLIKQGAALVATWEDVWEELPADVRLALTPPEQPASEGAAPASLFDGAQLPPSEKRVLSLLKVDESTHIDQIFERLNAFLSSSEIFEALFELELSSRIRALPGKYYVKTM
ncbi:MAG TPA: DNA-processing protein DprA [Bryocella sp.]|nr:DNA-processing protein DprA [Bryocella sp.]